MKYDKNSKDHPALIFKTIKIKIYYIHNIKLKMEFSIHFQT